MVGCDHIQKFLVAVFSRSESTDDIRMTSRIEARLHLIEFDNSTLVLVKSGERLSYDVDTVCIQFTKDSSDKLINANGAVSVMIKYGKYLISLRPSAANPIII